MVGELYALLESSGEAGPYVLVGTGFGGLVSQMYATQHPEQVAGLVLVDSLYGDWQSRMPQGLVNAEARRLPILAGRRLLAWLGVLGLPGRCPRCRWP
jgi:pimeloyl-ACP methyl ester carboxylesterase